MSSSKISIVTPNFNQGAFIERTILSVISQGYPNLEYIIIDGGSTDDSISIIKKYEQHLSYWISEPDEGMYHALAKGFVQSTGDIMGWINSDDVLLSNSLFEIARAFHNPEVLWIQGVNTVINEEGEVISVVNPYNVSKYNFLCGEYLHGATLKSFGTIQQESTYWRRSLWLQSGGLSTKYNYAGDFALWMSFFRYAKMHITALSIGAFRLRNGQLSAANLHKYIEEANNCVTEEMKLISVFELLRVKKRKLGNKLVKGFKIVGRKFLLLLN